MLPSRSSGYSWDPKTKKIILGIGRYFRKRLDLFFIYLNSLSIQFCLLNSLKERFSASLMHSSSISIGPKQVKTCLWKAFMSNLSPNSSWRFLRAFCIPISPILYDTAWPGKVMYLEVSWNYIFQYFPRMFWLDLI